MASLRVLTLLVVALGFLSVAQNVIAETAESSAEVPFLLVSKSVKIKKIREDNEDITVNIKIYNAGGSIAYDVSLDDENWPSDLFEVVGNATHSWDSLAMGTSVSHSYVVKPKEKGTFVTPPATVKFRVTSQAQLLTAKSTGVPELDLLAPEAQGAKYLWLKDLAIQFGPLVGALSLVGVALLIVFAPITSKRSSKKRR
ncbi:hypothetical protein CLOM_g2455 [Closterium sp. NIES-68]|nr:hypothetical protein CLOM_g2455 [Closterium sp. NIES-68]GJP74358.1 hypothetical protein CLOP_g4951 [Closterium sp. NIES-67]